MPTTLAIIEDHRLFREALVEMLRASGDFRVVAEAADGGEGIAAVETTDPNVVLLDVVLPGASGITVARELRRRNPQRRILMLSMKADEESVARCLEAGAMGYAGKWQPMSEVARAIGAVASGQTYVAPEVAGALDLRGRTDAEGPLTLRRLTAREREVFDLAVRGFTTEQIAQQLFISTRTVETHRSRILRKLGVHSTVDLVRLAVRLGLLNE